MPKQELARDRQPSSRIQAVIDQLHGGRVPIDPTTASWHDPDSPLPGFAYYNFVERRFEYGKGKIPQDLLWQYDDPAYREDDR